MGMLPSILHALICGMHTRTVVQLKLWQHFKNNKITKLTISHYAIFKARLHPAVCQVQMYEKFCLIFFESVFLICHLPFKSDVMLNFNAIVFVKRQTGFASFLNSCHLKVCGRKEIVIMIQGIIFPNKIFVF